MPGRHGQPIVPLHKKMTRKHWIAVTAGALAVVTLATSTAFATVHYFTAEPASHLTAYSINDLVSNSKDVSRSTLRAALKNNAGDASADTQYIKVVINGASRMVLGTDFTDVKSVLAAGNITLEDTDSITPSLDTAVKESTVIKITRADSTIETVEQSLPFNTVEIKDDSLPEGTKKVTVKGKEGIVEQTNLVTKNGDSVIYTSTITEYVKAAPVNEEVHVGTKKSTAVPSTGSAQLGTTVPVSEAQAIAHEMVLARGWSESDFTALVNLWNKESGWRTTAANPSGAYGIPQALPGSKMASAGADWQTNATTQITWGIGYIAGRYGTPSAAWAHSQAYNWY
ncbi:G5 domain-containing protein [Alloscardovia omnicolens]|uniref:aggregation-promoting factor C-terminal-like domain-containing protein n=1 Tax=Alloscardovia omnicolens TaxID=419015 RepID=UPI003A606482